MLACMLNIVAIILNAHFIKYESGYYVKVFLTIDLNIIEYYY